MQREQLQQIGTHDDRNQAHCHGQALSNLTIGPSKQGGQNSQACQGASQAKAEAGGPVPDVCQVRGDDTSCAIPADSVGLNESFEFGIADEAMSSGTCIKTTANVSSQA